MRRSTAAGVTLRVRGRLVQTLGRDEKEGAVGKGNKRSLISQLEFLRFYVNLTFQHSSFQVSMEDPASQTKQLNDRYQQHMQLQSTPTVQ